MAPDTKRQCGAKIKDLKMVTAEHQTKCGALGDCTGGRLMKPVLLSDNKYPKDGSYTILLLS